MTDLMAEAGLFDYEAPPAVSLADRFGVPPFSILDRRAGYWQARRDRWLSLGIRSELGRGDSLIATGDTGYVQAALPMEERSDRSLEASAAGKSKDAERARRVLAERQAKREKAERALGFYRPGAGGSITERAGGRITGTSIFDPVLCELSYRWYTAPGMRVLDPFAGGSVRGIVAGMLQRHYLGVDLREEQVEADRQQGQELIPPELAAYRPQWRAGDSREVLARAPSSSVDFVFSCPPYADLEIYSDDPRDLSTMAYQDFLIAHDAIIAHACRALRPDRFAAWVISDVRDRKGHYRGLVHDAVRSFERAGLHFYNDAIVLDPVGSAAVRAGRIFLGGRKITRMHQHMLVFVKGDWKRATQALAGAEPILQVPGADEEENE